MKDLGWKLDYKRFRKYLQEKYSVDTAYLFVGYIPANSDLYGSLQKYGFILIFKESMVLPDGKVKGNCDAELVLQAMIDIQDYDQAIIVTGDGDFACLVKYLYNKNKLKLLLVPNKKRYSVLLKKTAKEKIDFIDQLRPKLEFEAIKNRHS